MSNVKSPWERDDTSQEELAALPEANPFPVLCWNELGEVIYLNPSARQFTAQIGHPDATIEQVMPTDFKGRVRELLESNQTVVNETHQALGRTLSITYKPLPQIRQILVIIVDVTDRVEAVQRCRTYAGELEEINRELQKTQTQLVHAEMMASLGNLVAGVVHEMNSPLSSIQSGAQVMVRVIKKMTGSAATDDETSGAAARTHERPLAALLQVGETILAACARMDSILASLRNFSRLDESAFKMADLHEGIESTLTLLAHKLGQRIQVERRYGELPRVMCLPSQLNQVFMKVLANAIQAIDGPGLITISTRTDGDTASIQIRDTGNGIPTEELPRVFDPGFTTKGVGVGTGLGLAIVYRIIQQHQGVINITSEPGKGCTVAIKLPLTIELPLATGSET